MANKKLIIESFGDVESILNGLLFSGYEVSITPVYHNPEEDKRRGHHPRTFIDKFIVEVGEKIERPKVDEEKIGF